MTIPARLMPSLESAIAYQGESMLYKELRSAFEDIVEKNITDTAKLAGYNLGGIIRHHTGLSVEVKFAAIDNAYAEPPMLDANSPLLQAWRGMSHDILEAEIIGYDRLAMTGTTKGTIDFTKSKVSGLFTKLPLKLLIGSNLWSRLGMNGGEVAAITLHEIGHLFTFLAFLTRSTTANIAITTAINALDGARTMEERLQLVHATEAKAKVKVEDAKALADPKVSKKEFEAVFIKAVIDGNLNSSTGAVFYDNRSAEFIADQFATRHGAGRTLALGLDKLYRALDPSYRRGLVMHYFVSALQLAGAVMLTVESMGILALLFLCTPGLYNEQYDRPDERLARVKRDIVQSLKARNVTEETRKAMVHDIDVIDALRKDVEDRRGFMELLWWACTPHRRRQLTQMQFQQELEKLINNDLFVAASKFTILTK